MIKKNRVQIILSSVVILLPMLAGLMMWNILPQRMTTHWGMGGDADGWSSKAFAVFALPLIMLALHWLCVLLTVNDPRNEEQSNKVFGMVLWIIPMVSLVVNGIVYATALGSTVGIDIGVRVLLGLIFIILGNYLPKCKRNHTIGVRVKWALQNEENWSKTHRFTGKLWVLCGVVVLATLFIPLESVMWAVLAVVLLLSFAPVIYSYVYYRKQLKAGTVAEEKLATSPREKKFRIISIIISIPILVFVGVILFTGNIAVRFGEDSFTLESGYWEDMTIDYARIDSMEYREQDDPGTRTFGFGSLKLLMGRFENEEFGSYTRYSFAGCRSCIVLRSDDNVLVFNGEDEESTRALYEELNKRVGK